MFPSLRAYLRTVHTYGARCCTALLKTRSVFTSAAQLRAAQRMCERPFTVYIGKPRPPSVSDNLFVSGFVQVLNDSSAIIGAENSTVKMNYICQFNGTHVHAHDLLLCWLHPQRKA